MKKNINYFNNQSNLNIPVKNLESRNKKIISSSKPPWIKIKIPLKNRKIKFIKDKIRLNNLHSVCEEASCPNLMECFSRGTATFMILGNLCTRNCPFCDVKHGRPLILDNDEPIKLAKTIFDMKLNYVVITSVNRDDLKDGGAQHFVNCINAIRIKSPNTKIEILVPDFRHCMEKSLELISISPPDVFSHNLENVPRLYKLIRPGSDYFYSLKLLKFFKQKNKNLPTKSSLMMGLGETNEEILNVMYDLRCQGVTMLTIGQYLQPSCHHLPVKRYIAPEEFNNMKLHALSMGFIHVTCGPLVRSSYHADNQFNNI